MFDWFLDILQETGATLRLPVSFVVIEFIGTFAFAISGVRLSSAKQFDIFGAWIVGMATAIGGGTLRDLLLDVPPFWMANSSYCICCALAVVWVMVFGKYLILMGRTFSRPERMRMFAKKYVKEMSALGVDSVGIVLLISFFIGAVICIQMKLNIQSPWMPKFVTGYTTREIMLLEFSSSIMCLILAGKVGSNIASELGTMRVTQQIDALDIMGVNSASYLILPKILGMITIMPFLVIFSAATGILGAYATAYIGHVLSPEDLTVGLQHDFNPWFMWMSIIKSSFFAFIISSVASFCGYYVEGGSVEVGKASTSAVVTSSVLILFSDVFLTQLLS